MPNLDKISDSSQSLLREPRSPALKCVILGFSVVPLVTMVLAGRMKFFRYILAFLEVPGMLVICFLAGQFWYRLLTGQLTFVQRERRKLLGLGDSEDGFAIIAAIVFAFGIGTLLMELNTHEMVRAYWAVWPDHNEDD